MKVLIGGQCWVVFILVVCKVHSSPAPARGGLRSTSTNSQPPVVASDGDGDKKVGKPGLILGVIFGVAGGITALLLAMSLCKRFCCNRSQNQTQDARKNLVRNVSLRIQLTTPEMATTEVLHIRRSSFKNRRKSSTTYHPVSTSLLRPNNGLAITLTPHNDEKSFGSEEPDSPPGDSHCSADCEQFSDYYLCSDEPSSDISNV